MKAAKLVSLILVILLGVVIVSALIDNPIGAEKITNANTKEASLFEVIGDISIKVPNYSVGDTLAGTSELSELKRDNFIFFDGEEIDNNFKLKNNKAFVEILTIIQNNSDKAIELNLEEFYLVTIDNNWNIARGSTRPRYAYLMTQSSLEPLPVGATLEKFVLTLKPKGKTYLQIMYIEDHSNMHMSSTILNSICYFRVKCNNDIGYYNISCTLF